MDYKVLFAMASAAILLAGSCSSGAPFTVSASTEELDITASTIDSVWVEPTTVKVLSATTDGKSFLVKGKVEEPVYGSVKLSVSSEGKSNRTMTIPLIIEKGDVHYSVFRSWRAKDTPLNDGINEMMLEYTDLFQEVRGTEDETSRMADYLEEFITVHRDDPSSIYALSLGDTYLGADKKLSLIDNLTPRIRQVKEVVTMKKDLETIAATSPGKKFVDFSVEYDGKTTSLSDYAGKGSPVLLDFWASWCGPCREETPYIVAAFKEFGPKGLTVLGIPTNDKPSDTLAAMEELGITYPQMMNAQMVGAGAYGVKYIPTLILIGGDGTILRRDFRGEEIRQALLEIFPQ